MSESNGAEAQEQAPKRPNNLAGWITATFLLSLVNIVADANVDRAGTDSAAIIVFGLPLSYALALLKIPSPFIAVRLSKNAIANAVRKAREKRSERQVIDTE